MKDTLLILTVSAIVGVIGYFFGKEFPEFTFALMAGFIVYSLISR